MILPVCPRGPCSIPSHGGVFQGIFPCLITHTHVERRVAPPSHHKPIERIQELGSNMGPLNDLNGHGSLKKRNKCAIYPLCAVL